MSTPAAPATSDILPATPLATLSLAPGEPPAITSNNTAAVPETPPPPSHSETTPIAPTAVPTLAAGGSKPQVLLRLVDPLDEPEFYCIDVSGQRSNVQLQAPLQAHTCKPRANATDQLFLADHPRRGQFSMPAYSLCLEAGTNIAGSPLLLRSCSDSPLQLFSHSGQGLLRLEYRPDPGLCVASAGGRGIQAGGPSHLRRDLALQPCGTVDPSLAQWTLDGP